nr:hypothetical protein [uncultured Trichococcus sp.]
MDREVTNKRGITIKVGQVWFMESPASEQWPKAFPESSWMFIVRSVDRGMVQGPSVNWKRKGVGAWVSRELEEFTPGYFGDRHGLRLATDDEVKYFFKRAPGYKKYQEEPTC